MGREVGRSHGPDLQGKGALLDKDRQMEIVEANAFEEWTCAMTLAALSFSRNMERWGDLMDQIYSAKVESTQNNIILH